MAPIDIGNESMEDMSERNPLIFAALVALRKQLSVVGELRLSPLDFEAWGSAGAGGVLFRYDADTKDVVLTHVAERSDA